MQRSRSPMNNERRLTSAPADGGSGSSWPGRLLLEPIRDDARRVLSATGPATPTGSSDPSDRFIVGVGATGSWSSLVGELVQHNGTSWVAQDNHTGALVYSHKRDEYLTLLETIGASIAPTLTPEVLSYASTSLKFWMPNSLVDSFYSSYKGTVSSVTLDSGSWVAQQYRRYVVPFGDPTYSAFEDFIATYIGDINTNTGKWVFQQAREGDFLYSDGDNNYYTYNGTMWVVFTGGAGGVNTFYAAEGRASSNPATHLTLTAAALNTWQEIVFPYSAVTDLIVCPPAFFGDGESEFTAPRTGHYVLGYGAFYAIYESPEVDTVEVAVKVNGTIVEQAIVPKKDDFEGNAFHGIFKLEAGDVVTLSFRTTGTNYGSDVTFQNGPNMYVYTVDAIGASGGDQALNEHTDTNFPSPSDGDTIVWDSGTGKWVNAAAPPPGPHSLGSHDDTNFTSLTTNDVVQWDGTEWVNQPIVAVASPHDIISVSHGDSLLTGSLAAAQVLKRNSGNTKWTNGFVALSELSDAAISSPSGNQVLTYNSGTSKWVNAAVPTPSLDSLSNVSTVGKVPGDFLWWTGTNWMNRAIRLDDLYDVVSTAPATGQSLVWNGSNWVPGNPTATVGALYFSGTWNNVNSWTAVSSGGGSFTTSYPTLGSPWPFFQPPSTGHYEMIVSGSVTPGSVGSLTAAVCLNSIGSPLGATTTLYTSIVGASMSVSIHACAYLSGGNKLGFAQLSGASSSWNLNMSIKKIGD